MSGAGPASGTLPANQVRVMFDRIARGYDRMNSVMTRACITAGANGRSTWPGSRRDPGARRGHRHR